MITGTNAGNQRYNVSNATLEEFEDGTATLTAHFRNHENTNIRWDASVHFSGRTFDAPANSPRESNCFNIEGSDFYYYTTASGTLTGTNDIAGAVLNISLLDHAMQFGTGANLNDPNLFGASAWLDYAIVSQPNNTNRQLETGAQVDFNWVLTGGQIDCPNTSNPTPSCNDFDYTGLDYLGTFDGKDYYIKPDGDVNYNTALGIANDAGGTLLVINSAAENAFIAGLLNQTAWLGLNDVASEGNFEWYTGDNLSYTNWNTNEPNNFDNEDYAVMFAGGSWNDIKGTAINWAVVEFPECNDSTPSCDDFDYTGLDYFGTFDDKDYYIKPDGDVNYNTALSIANNAGGRLLTITNAAENAYVANLLSGKAWLGLTDVANEGEFVLNTGEAVTYTNWETNQPSNNNNNEHNAEININGLWNDLPASLIRWAIVEFPVCTPSQNSIVIQDDELEQEADERTDEEAVIATTFGIYPNPATTSVNVSLKNANGTAVVINVYDQLGRLIERTEADAAYDSVYRINTADYNAGLYLIRVQSGDAPVMTKQLVILPH